MWGMPGYALGEPQYSTMGDSPPIDTHRSILRQDSSAAPAHNNLHPEKPATERETERETHTQRERDTHRKRER